MPLEALAASGFLIETLWVSNQSTCDFLIEYLARTHTVEIIEQQPRDTSTFPELMELDRIDRLPALWEGQGPDPWLNIKLIT